MPEPLPFRVISQSSPTPKPLLPKNSPLSSWEQSKLEGLVLRLYALAIRNRPAARLALEWGDKILKLLGA